MEKQKIFVRMRIVVKQALNQTSKPETLKKYRRFVFSIVHRTVPCPFLHGENYSPCKKHPKSSLLARYGTQATSGSQ